MRGNNRKRMERRCGVCLNVFVTCWLLLGRCGCGCCTALGLGSLHAHVEKLSVVAAEAKRHGGACRKLRAGVGVRTSSNLEFGGCREGVFAATFGGGICQNSKAEYGHSREALLLSARCLFFLAWNAHGAGGIGCLEFGLVFVLHLGFR